jgi:hypothetical protein
VALIVLLLLCCAGVVIAVNVLGNDDDNNATSGTTTPRATPTPTAPMRAAPANPTGAVGSTVTDGQLQFTVVSAQCGLSQVGTPDRHATAKGQYCVIGMTVRNVGSQSRLFSDLFQRGYDTNGDTHRPDSRAGAYANEGHAIFFSKITPGNEVSGSLVFDIPKDVQLKRLELHDSPGSQGVSVVVS